MSVSFYSGAEQISFRPAPFLAAFRYSTGPGHDQADLTRWMSEGGDAR
jgi:hypothetical protein